MNKIIVSDIEEGLAVPQEDMQWQSPDLDNEETDIAFAIFDAHDDPC
jgi:hypothetical protein